MENDKKFADGFIFKRNERAPEFVVGGLSVRVDEAIEFLKQNQKNGWVNLNIKQGRSGKYYIELDTYEPKTTETPQNENKSRTMTEQQFVKTAEKINKGETTVYQVKKYFDLTPEQLGILQSAEDARKVVITDDDELPF